MSEPSYARHQPRVDDLYEFPITNGVQRTVLLEIFDAGVPNETRLAVAAAFLQTTINDIYKAIGLTPSMRMNFRGNNNGIAWEAGPAWYWSYRVALALGFTAAEMWELDEHFDPLDCVPLAFEYTGHVQKKPLELKPKRGYRDRSDKAAKPKKGASTDGNSDAQHLDRDTAGYSAGSGG